MITTKARAYALTTTDGLTVRDHLPDWAETDPSSDEVGPGQLGAVLADVVLEADAGGLVLPVVHGQDPAEQAAVLALTIMCKPFGQEDEPRIPVVDVQLVEDFWLKGLNPQGVRDFGQRLRALGDLLVDQVAPNLEAARADWSRHHPTFCLGAVGQHAQTTAGKAVEATPATGRVRSAPRMLRQEPQAVTWARERAGLTKRSLAQQVGVSEQLIGDIESGRRSATPAILPKIAEVLNCPVVALERKRNHIGSNPKD